jgi:hypothetical protein
MAMKYRQAICKQWEGGIRLPRARNPRGRVNQVPRGYRRRHHNARVVPADRGHGGHLAARPHIDLVVTVPRRPLGARRDGTHRLLSILADGMSRRRQYDDGHESLGSVGVCTDADVDTTNLAWARRGPRLLDC